MIIQATLLIALFQGSAEPQRDTNALVLSELDQNILRRFDSLPEEEQLRIAEELQQEVLALDHPLCEAARSLLKDRKLKNVEQVRKGELALYSAEQYAPNLRLKTKFIKPTSKSWKSFVKRTFRNGLPQRESLWDWDYGQNLLRTPPQRAPRDIVVDFLVGRWPLDGKLAAYAEGALDRDNKLDATADYFAHAYRNRSGKVFQGITLYDVWNAQTTFGISDVEAIAFLRNVAKNSRHQSPLPASLHTAIYKEIEVQFEKFRDYRSLRHALAQRFLNPNGTLPVQFRGIAATLDQAWVLMEHKPRRMATFLDRHPTRKQFLAALAEQLPPPGKENTIKHWADHWQARTTLPGLMRGTALDFLGDEGLLGFRRR